MILGVDVSYWQQNVDWPLLKAAGVEFVFIKATQGNYFTDAMMRQHVAGAIQTGMVIGLYHWCDPTVGAESQAQYFIDKTKDVPFHLGAADVEQQWASWSEWRQHNVTSILSPDVISRNAKTIISYWDQRLSVKTLIYTRASFITEYARPMIQWVCGYPLWLATYPYGPGRITTTWETFKTKYLPTTSGPVLVPNCPKWTFWQFTGDKFILPGVNSALDINYFNGTLEELRVLAGLQAPPPPPPPALTLEERVAKLEVEARKHGWAI